MSQSVTLSIDKVGKQFYRNWLFRHLNLKISEGESLAVIGHNGSGKSTLLRIIASQMVPTEGKVTLRIGGTPVPANQMYQHLSWSAPYIGLFPELTLREQFRLQGRFRTMMLPESEFLSVLSLSNEADKPLRFYSSGMLQRAKAGLAIFAQGQLLLLDEPTSNMDEGNAGLIQDLLETYQRNRILILASNLEREFGKITRQIHLGKRAIV